MFNHKLLKSATLLLTTVAGIYPYQIFPNFFGRGESSTRVYACVNVTENVFPHFRLAGGTPSI